MPYLASASGGTAPRIARERGDRNDTPAGNLQQDSSEPFRRGFVLAWIMREGLDDGDRVPSWPTGPRPAAFAALPTRSPGVATERPHTDGEH